LTLSYPLQIGNYSNLTELLDDRYKVSNIGEFLFDDFIFLKTLKDSLADELKVNNDWGQPKRFLMETLIDTLENICDHLDRTKKR
jgi:hypothetical protein